MMKVNILFDNPGGVRSGYLNIDAFAPNQKGLYIQHGLLDIHNTVDRGSITEVVALNVLPYLSIKEVPLALDSWVSLLAHGGKITLSAPDIFEINRLVYHGSLPLEQYAQLVYGPQDRPWKYHKSPHSTPDLIDALTRRGLRVVLKRIEGCNAVVTAERP